MDIQTQIIPTTVLYFCMSFGGHASERLMNLSTNGYVGDFGLRAGFIIDGHQARRLIVMGERYQSDIDPILRVTDITGSIVLAQNDDWLTHDTADEVTNTLGRTPGSTDDAALAVTLEPGVYLAVLESNNDRYGQGIVAINDFGANAQSTRLLNISTNGFLTATALSAGFIVDGTQPRRVIILGEQHNSNLDVTLALRDLFGNVLYFNDNWRSERSSAEIQNRLRALGADSDAGFAITLAPGAYIAELEVHDEGQGNAIVAINDINPLPSVGIQRSQFLNTQWQGVRRLTSLGAIFPGHYCEWQVQIELSADLTGSVTAQLITDTSNGLVGCPAQLSEAFDWDVSGDAVLGVITNIIGAGGLIFGDDISPCGNIETLRAESTSVLFENVINDLSLNSLTTVRVNCTGEYHRM